MQTITLKSQDKDSSGRKKKKAVTVQYLHRQYVTTKWRSKVPGKHQRVKPASEVFISDGSGGGLACFITIPTCFWNEAVCLLQFQDVCQFVTSREGKRWDRSAAYCNPG